MSYSYQQYPMARSGNTRSFKVGEPVVLGNGHSTSGSYVSKLTTPNTGYTYGHVVRSDVPGFGPSDKHMYSHQVGKIHQPISATAAGTVAREAGLPANIGRTLSRYGGGSKKMGKSRRSLYRKKLKSRRRPRKN